MIIVRGCSFPADRHYHVEYNVWLRPEEPGVVTLGATSYGVAEAVEFIAFVPKPAGMRIDANRAVGLLEIAKTITSVRTPGDCTVVAANQVAVADPSIINSDPYGRGWLLKLAFDDWGHVRSSLVDGESVATAFEQAMSIDGFEGV